jgi:hypothetical protein
MFCPGSHDIRIDPLFSSLSFPYRQAVVGSVPPIAGSAVVFWLPMDLASDQAETQLPGSEL